MQPRFRRHEAPHEQRRGDGAGLAAGADIVDIGDLGLKHRFIGTPQRQPPERVILRSGVPYQRAGKRVVVGEEGRHLRSERGARGAGQRGEIDLEQTCTFDNRCSAT